ncbi:UNVERIFIED_CONTAM: DNA replication ATP-dependent helicase/nuclease JHS1 [Sesamum angustifolium]|uniref:DNA replication ATP-dependent helicase/nuclease JHS1 n=1 Tax=Sesamum angustifolium TaxID=2727405 RepID=A0AAW2RJ16_9LAMI
MGGNFREVEASSPSQDTPVENVLPVVIDNEENQLEVSPEASKSFSVKRFKFSPGMLIKQSQDDVIDEVTWKISPVNERLHAMSKHLPGRMRVLADSTRINSMDFQQCSQQKVQTSADMAGKLERWLASPPLKAENKSLVCSDGVASRKVNTVHDLNGHGNHRNIKSNDKSEVPNTQSPFSTPPSLSCCHDKALDDVHSNGVPDQLGSRQHKKALIELLDQVEDVISVEHSICKDNEKLFDAERRPTADHVVNRLTTNSEEKVCTEDSRFSFLVLEVSEKLGPAESSGPQSCCKVLRLLNEQTGDERALQLWDEWYFTVVAPGDTVHVIGEFDAWGKCDVIVMKIFSLSTQIFWCLVSASFSCPRRTILDERLKHSEHSAAALMGTLLHQIFQGSKGPSIDFKCEGLKEIKISEVIDIEEMAWAPKYGLKGMIDASVRVRTDTSSAEAGEMIMPLEFKTGKGRVGRQTAMEHSAQVMLYTLLMSERYMMNINMVSDLSSNNQTQVAKKESWCSQNSKNDPVCLSSLILDASDKLSQKKICRGNRFVYRFVHRELPLLDTDKPSGDSLSSSSFLENLFRNGDYVILSKEPGNLRVANGVIVDIGDSHVSVSFAKRLRLPGHSPGSMPEHLHQQSWRIDKDEVMASFAIMRYNLIQLFLQNEYSSHLRMVVDLEMPRFDSGCIFSQDPAISYIWAEKSLNDDQRRAILKILTAGLCSYSWNAWDGQNIPMVHAVKAY